jgi:hypothetical protein
MLEWQIKEYLKADDVVEIRRSNTIANDEMEDDDFMFDEEHKLESDVFDLIIKDFDFNNKLLIHNRICSCLIGLQSRYGNVVYLDSNYSSFYIKAGDLNKIYKIK